MLGAGAVQTQESPEKTAQSPLPACTISAFTLAQTINRSLIIRQIA